jgi:hypothetical protein
LYPIHATERAVNMDWDFLLAWLRLMLVPFVFAGLVLALVAVVELFAR